MSRSGFGLLIGWLTEGVGGEATGAGEGFQGEKGKRGRAAVMRVVNNHLRFDGKFDRTTSECNIHTIYSYFFQSHISRSKYLGRVHWFTLLPYTSDQRCYEKDD